MFDVDLQFFGGGGSKSGLGGGKGGGGSGKSGDSSAPKGYLFYFFKDGKQGLRWVKGSTPREALNNANEIAKKHGFVVSNPMGDHMTYDEAKKKKPGLKQAGK